VTEWLEEPTEAVILGDSIAEAMKRIDVIAPSVLIGILVPGGGGITSGQAKETAKTLESVVKAQPENIAQVEEISNRLKTAVELAIEGKNVKAGRGFGEIPLIGEEKKEGKLPRIEVPVTAKGEKARMDATKEADEIIRKYEERTGQKVEKEQRKGLIQLIEEPRAKEEISPPPEEVIPPELLEQPLTEEPGVEPAFVFEPIPEKRTARQSGLKLDNKIKTAEGYLTNGQWAIKPEYANANLKKAFEKGLREDNPEMEPILAETRKIATKPAKEVARTNLGYLDTPASVFRAEDGTTVGFQSGFIDYFTKNIKDFNMKVSTPNTAGLMLSGGNEVGMIMPMNVANEEGEAVLFNKELDKYLGVEEPEQSDVTQLEPPA
jgi:hypothetical protein